MRVLFDGRAFDAVVDQGCSVDGIQLEIILLYQQVCGGVDLQLDLQVADGVDVERLVVQVL